MTFLQLSSELVVPADHEDDVLGELLRRPALMSASQLELN